VADLAGLLFNCYWLFLPFTGQAGIIARGNTASRASCCTRCSTFLGSQRGRLLFWRSRSWRWRVASVIAALVVLSFNLG